MKNCRMIKVMEFRKRIKEEEIINKKNEPVPKKRKKMCTVRKKEISPNDPNEAMLQVIQVLLL